MSFGRRAPGKDPALTPEEPAAVPGPTPIPDEARIPEQVPVPEALHPQEQAAVPASAEQQPAESSEPAQAQAGRQQSTSNWLTPANSPATEVVRSPVYAQIRQTVLGTIDVAAALSRSSAEIGEEIQAIIADTVQAGRLAVTLSEQKTMVREILNDMFGVGPIEPLLHDDTVTDIMVNGPDQIYVERFGKLELTPLKFRDNIHVINVAQRIASAVGRRVDESVPMVDARLPDGSRVNVILPPLAIDGATISIRKFSRKDLTLPRLAARGALSAKMARLLEIAAACRLNVIISGGTGSGKTTLLNALSRFIFENERVITIEDAAELQLQQPHVVRLETRPASLEGTGQISQKELVRNALRMRPDRIILGETRGAEALDVLQAMNTGHDGSMTTLHANNPRDALTRLESMVLMANGSLPLLSIRQQIASAVNLIVQSERMRDGQRRITSITEIVGMEESRILTQELFRFRSNDEVFGERVLGSFETNGTRPLFAERARYYGMETALMEAMLP